ncbi:MAG: tRNA (adenosine(37)-N6)-threonylcarbamoyltransferase complex transferase subunit TsaD [Candidatus Omnitrophota bacterium]|nr:tRNA (adenosine(37)-N6)-threonylcarbamoyltransferase complex transferase subunit TsaD [Candidatus Omnitrophota bacterium]
MIVLGVESSCDETSVALVKDGKDILSNVVASSLKFHSKHGGVVPEIASRMQLESISGVFLEAIKIAGIKTEDIDLVSVTSGPGLPGSLLVGISFAKALALSLNKPIFGVNHIHSHIYANLLCHKDIKLPCIALIVSGGHTTLFYIKDFSEIKTIGQTLDDACGEAFDKVAKIMGMDYPGGPEIEKFSKGADKHKFKFACCGTDDEFNFSFSGIKTALLYSFKNKKISAKLKKDMAASFQESIIKALVKKSISACKHYGVRNLLIGGGVIANCSLRQRFSETAQENGLNCFFPDTFLCMDNAAMVAGLANYLYKQGKRSNFNLNIEFN